MRSHWLLEEGVVFLNHGSFGACPRLVLEAQARLRERMEREPVRFFVRELEPLIAEAREQVARFVGAAPERLLFVRNATSAVNAVVGSLELSPGDELLTTDHEYNACRNVLEHAARQAGARVVTAKIPFPVSGPDEVVAAILAVATDRTRLALVDHVTSPTGLVLPIERIVAALADRGVDTLVDGAHGPGMLPLDLETLGAAFYTGNFHKWVCAPKGAGMLWVRADRADGIHPAVISHGYNSERPRSMLLEEFDWTGTDDPTPWLCVPDAIRFVGGLVPGGWPEVRARNHALVLEGRRILCEALGQIPAAPEEMIGSLASVCLPDGSGAPPRSALAVDPLQDALYDRHRIEVPIVPWPSSPGRLVRISAQLYNGTDDYRALAAALLAELGC